jgi:preprotein translocase subunit SecE
MTLKNNPVVNYFREAKIELEKVVWPTRKETIQYTVLVIAVSVGLAAFLAGVDFGLAKGVELLVSTR